MKGNEKLAVLIPHFNQRAELEQTLRSITFAGELNVIVVDDGSNEQHRVGMDWIQSLNLLTPVEVIWLERNQGITRALNAGLKVVFDTPAYTYLARLDCGDYNDPKRLDTQYEFMEQNPGIALCGTWAAVVDNYMQVQYTLKPPQTHAGIARKMKSGNCFVHPSVMMRVAQAREIGFYPEAYPAAEDYAYFFAFVKRFKTANLPNVLIFKTRTASSISYAHRTTQLLSRIKVIVHNFSLHPQSLWGLVKALVSLVIPVRVLERLKERRAA
jgi:glycosyltransferase involved in cell wall biosynthesis